MADNCEKTLSYRTYRRTGEARGLTISKAPPNAPEPRKSRAEAKAELERRVDEDMAERSAEPVPQCDPCGVMTDKSTVELFITVGNRQWREDYQLQDANGNTIAGTALYTARADIDAEATIHTKICGPASFGDKLAALSDFSFEVPADRLAALDYDLLMDVAGKDANALAALGVTATVTAKRPRKG